MGQKVNPIGFRTGIMMGWKSRWYASKKEFADLLIEDQKLRKYIHEKYKFAGISKVEIERTRDAAGNCSQPRSFTAEFWQGREQTHRVWV